MLRRTFVFFYDKQICSKIFHVFCTKICNNKLSTCYYKLLLISERFYSITDYFISDKTMYFKHYEHILKVN